MKYDQRNLRLMEELCTRLKELFCIGLIALMGHAAVTGNDVEALKTEWNRKMDAIDWKMKTMLDQCYFEFVDQAKVDVEKWIKDKGEKNNKECATYIKDKLVKKFDWVCWSVRVYDPIIGFDNHCYIGHNCFHFFRVSGVNVVVSYTTFPFQINKWCIRELMKKKNDYYDAKEVAEHVSNNLPLGHVVHTVRRHKKLSDSSNFPPSCYFWENYNGVTLCVHSIYPFP